MACKPFHYAVLLLAVHLVAGCSGESVTDPADGNGAALPSVANVQDAGQVQARDEKLVLAFGDSLYAGNGVEPDESFPSRLQAVLRARGIHARVHNGGVSGDTSTAGLQRLAFTLDGLPRAPDLVIVGLGGNDMLRGFEPEVTRGNLDAILAELARRKIPAMLTGMVAAPNLGRAYGTQFNAIYPDLARKYDVPLYPFFLEKVVDQPDLMQDDRIHPKAAGIDVVVERVTPIVAKALAKEYGASRARPGPLS